MSTALILIVSLINVRQWSAVTSICFSTLVCSCQSLRNGQVLTFYDCYKLQASNSNENHHVYNGIPENTEPKGMDTQNKAKVTHTKKVGK